MLNKGVLSLLITALALLASPGLTPPVAAAPITWLVGADRASCAGKDPDFPTIFEAILTASPGDTIHVCPGDYTEPSMTIYDNELIIEGSGAGVTHVGWTGNKAAMFFVVADHVVIEGLDLDATPAHPTDASTGISIGGDALRSRTTRYATRPAWRCRQGTPPRPATFRC